MQWIQSNVFVLVPWDSRPMAFAFARFTSGLDDALALVEKAFRDSTLGDLIREPSKSKPLCEFPNLAPRRRGA